MPIQADTATLNAAANDLRTTKQNVEGELGKLRGEVESLAPAWTGAAGGGFQNVMRNWDKHTRDLVEAMEGIADMLVTAGAEITETDEAELRELNKYDSALNQ